MTDICLSFHKPYAFALWRTRHHTWSLVLLHEQNAIVMSYAVWLATSAKCKVQFAELTWSSLLVTSVWKRRSVTLSKQLVCVTVLAKFDLVLGRGVVKKKKKTKKRSVGTSPCAGWNYLSAPDPYELEKSCPLPPCRLLTRTRPALFLSQTCTCHCVSKNH